VIGSAVNLLASILGTKFLGLAGPAIGTTVMLSLTCVWIPLLLRRDLQIPLGSLCAALVIPVALATLCGVAVLILVPTWTRAPGWITLAFRMLVTAAGFLLLAWSLVLDRSERTMWIQRLRGFLPRSAPQLEGASPAATAPPGAINQ